MKIKILEEIKKIISTKNTGINYKELEEETILRDEKYCILSSLDFIELIMELENIFRIEIAPDRIVEISTIKDLIVAIEEKYE